VFAYQDRPDVRVELPVEVTVKLPSVTRVAPFVVYDQVASELVVRGVGLDGLGGQPLRVGAATATNVRVVNGSELRATAPALAAGTHAVRVLNALGVATASADLLVTARV
jgi:hypothetical protein